MSDMQTAVVGEPVLDGLVNRDELARQLSRSTRTIIRFEDQGLFIAAVDRGFTTSPR
jgi:hypothetical protein